MPLESATYISELDPTNPVGSSDLVSSLDDHMRLVKATLQNTFPNIDGAVNATEEQINLLAATSPNDRVLRISSGAVGWGQLTTGMFPSQVVPDSALSNNVPLKNAPNVFTGQVTFTGGFVYQNDDEDARLRINITTGGRIYFAPWYNGAYNFNREFGFDPTVEKWYAEGGLNTGEININGSANISGTLTVGGAATFSNSATISGDVWLSSGTPRVWLQETDAGPDNGLWHIQASGGVLSIGVRTDAFAADNIISVTRSGGTVGTVTIGGDVRASRIATSTSTTLSAGQIHAVTGNSTLPNMTAGQWVGVINNSNSPITVTKNASDTMYWTASGSSVTSVTVAARGKATFICADGTNVYASGNISGSS